MTDFDLADFETTFAQRLGRYAAIPVRQVDSAQVARDARGVGNPTWLRWPALPRLSRAPAMVLVVLGLLLALLLAAVAAELLRRPEIRPLGRNGLIAFQVAGAPKQDWVYLHLVNPDGSGDRVVAEGARAAFSPDGSRLAYYPTPGVGPSIPSLVVANGDGSSPVGVTDRLLLGFAMSPDGSRLLVHESSGDPFAEEGPISLVTVANGAQKRLDLISADMDRLSFTDFVWSPDGKTIAYAVMGRLADRRYSGIYRTRINLVDVESGAVTRLTSRLGSVDVGMSWSPDSLAIAFQGFADASPLPSPPPDVEADTGPLPQDVFVIRVDGSGERNVTNTPGFERQPRWSPDGSAIAYQAFQETEYHVAVSRMNGLNAVESPVVGPPAGQIIWSPDGSKLLLVRSEPIPGEPCRLAMAGTVTWRVAAC
jgi:hypothetical protein